MTYAQGFNLSTPTGLEEANTLDEIIRNVKIALNERFVDILGVDLSSATDPQRVTKIVIPSAGTTIRDSSDANSMIAITNSSVTLRNAAFTGSAVTLPSGSAITNASLATPALVDAVLGGTTVNTGTISGGAVSNLTALTVTGTPVFTGNLTVTGTVTAGALSGPTTVPAANVTAGTFQNAAYTFPNNLNVSGTLAPTTLTIPSGTTIPTHTETGTITATGSTRNGGTLSGATLNNTTFTGTTSGLSTNPVTSVTSTLVNSTIGSTTTTLLSLTVSTAGQYLVIAQVGIAMSPNGVALERLGLDLVASGVGPVAQSSFGVTAPTSGTLQGVYGPASLMSVISIASSTTFTLTGYKFTAGNTAQCNNGTLIAMRIN
jgi:hypothetical protein